MSSKPITFHYRQAVDTEVAELKAWASSAPATLAIRILQSQVAELHQKIAQLRIELSPVDDLIERAQGFEAVISFLETLPGTPAEEFKTIDQVIF